MKKIILTFIVFAFLANASAQLEVKSSGDTYVSKNIYLESASNFLGTTNNNVPITFKVNTFLAGFTGSDSNSNVSFGYRALLNTGTQNTAIGCYALRQNSSGYGNTAVGYNALYYSALGYNNTAIGSWANVGDPGPNGCFSNSTAIGYQARVDQSNTIVLGNNTVTHLKLHNTIIYQTSDSRIKKNIRAEVPGLAFINQLQPVMYNLDLNALDELQKSDDPKINAFRDSLLMARSTEEKEIDAKARANKEKIVYSGFIAQDVEKAAQNVGYDFSGIDVPANGKGVYGLGYTEFVVPLVKAVQELSEQNDQLKERVNELTGLVYQLLGKEDASLRSSTNETETTGITDAVVAQCKLFQNAPNPFNQSTEIKYYLPEDVKTAYLCIYNLQGTQIKQISIMLRGEGSQLISGSELAAGMYLYALIVDGKEVDTKRMILTK